MPAALPFKTVMNIGNVEDIYPLTLLQATSLSVDEIKPHSGTKCASFFVFGNVDINALKTAWQEVVQKHAVMRTAFAWKRLDRPMQVVLKSVDAALEQHDWTNTNPSEQELRFARLV